MLIQNTKEEKDNNLSRSKFCRERTLTTRVYMTQLPLHITKTSGCELHKWFIANNSAKELFICYEEIPMCLKRLLSKFFMCLFCLDERGGRD